MNRIAPLLLICCAAVWSADEAQAACPQGCIVAFGPMGFAGSYTPMATLVRNQLESGEAETIFLALSHERHACLQLYGAWGLRLLDSPAFAKTRTRLADDRRTIDIAEGCIVETLSMTAVLDRIAQIPVTKPAE